MPVGEPAGRRELPLIARPGRPRTELPLRSTLWPVGAAPVLESKRTPTQRPDLWIARQPPPLPTAAWIRATLAARPSWSASSTRSPSSRDNTNTHCNRREETPQRHQLLPPPHTHTNASPLPTLPTQIVAIPNGIQRNSSSCPCQIDIIPSRI